MDLDLARVRSFVAAADLRHFGRAAAELAISQQALSKRIARLEADLGVRLFDRGRAGGLGLRLTEEGRRFLEPARAALAAGDQAVSAAHGATRPLRLDVWGHLYAPMRTVAVVLDALPEPAVETGAGRDLRSVAAGLLRGDADAGFGRVHPLSDGEDAALAHRLIRFEPVDAIFGPEHPLAGADSLCPARLRDSVLWCPAEPHRLDFLQRFADAFEITARTGGPNLGLPHFLAQLRADPRAFSLFPADCPLPDDCGVRAVPLVSPVPLYAWSLVWPAERRHPRLDTLLRALARAGADRRWLEYRPERDWLPESAG